MKLRISVWTICLIILLGLMAFLHSDTENSMDKQWIKCEELDAEQSKKFIDMEYNPAYPLQHLIMMDFYDSVYGQCIKEYNRFKGMNSFQGYAVIVLFMFILMSWRIDMLKNKKLK